MAKIDVKSFNDFVKHQHTEKVKDFISVNRATINLSTKLIQTGISLVSAKNNFDKAKVIFHSVDEITSGKNSYFYTSAEKYIKIHDLKSFKLDLDAKIYSPILSKMEKVQAGESHLAYTIFYLGKIKFISYKDYGISNYYAKVEDQQIIKDFLNQSLRDLFPNNISLGKEFTREDYSYNAVLTKDNIYAEISDPKYRNLAKNAIDKGIKRSFLFWGPPGTGKTTVANDIVYSLKLRSLRIENLAEVFVKNLKPLFEVFNFDAVLIDDFDHNSEALKGEALAALEFFKKNSKIVIGTANVIAGLNPAIIRPGRFDEVIHVDHLDDTTVKSILQPYGYLFDEVKKLPAAYIIELVDRIKLYGHSNIESDLAEISQRANCFVAQLSGQPAQPVRVKKK